MQRRSSYEDRERRLTRNTYIGVVVTALIVILIVLFATG